MFTKKRALIIPVVVLIFAMVITATLTGCGSKKSTSSKSSPISIVDGQTLDSAYADYDTLRQTLSPAEARKALVKELNAQTNIVQIAELGVDGYTIFITYKDGNLAGVDTFSDENNAAQKSGTSAAPSDKPSVDTYVGASALNLVQNHIATLLNSFPIGGLGTSGFTQLFATTTTPNKMTATSKKVLVLSPLYADSDINPLSDTITSLKTYGWEDSDIVFKHNTSVTGPGAFIVKPEDLFNLSDYGVIIYSGHGLAKTGFTEDQMYLNWCYLTHDQLNDLGYWAGSDQILVTKEYYPDGWDKLNFEEQLNEMGKIISMVSIRGDILRQKMSKLPSSYVQMSTCYSSYFKKIFLDKGAKILLAWDNPVEAKDGDADIKNMVALMLKGNSVYDAFQNNMIIKQSDSIKGLANFLICTSGIVETVAPYYYLPAWINLKVPMLPVGTSSLKVDIWDLGKNRYITENKVLSPGQSSVEIDNFGDNCFPAGSCSVVISALDSKGSTLLAKEVPFTLPAGANDLTISISNFEYALSGSQDPQASINFSRSGGIWLYIKLNGQYLVNGVWSGVLEFNAHPGDELEIMVVGNSGETFSPDVFSASLGPLWFTSWLTGEQVKLTDSMNFKQYFGYGDTVVFDKKFIIPGSKPSTTQTSTSTTTTTTTTITNKTITTTTGTPTTSTLTTGTPTTSTTSTTTTTFTNTTTQTSTPLTQVNVWLTTTNDSNATHVSTLKTGAVTTLYIWAQGGNGQTGDFNLSGTLQNGTQMQLGTTKHATPGNVIYCGQWNGGFLNTVGSVTVNATSGGTAVGSTSINITN